MDTTSLTNLKEGRGWRRALQITAFEILFAIGIGGIVFRLVSVFI